MKKVTLIPIRLADAAKLAAVPAGTALPSRLLVFPWGTHRTNKGVFIVNETTARDLVKNQLAAKYDRIALDFQHNTAPVMDPVSKEAVAPEILFGTPRSVAAYGTLSVEPNVGVWMENLEWTPEGEKAARNGDYADLSPTPIPNKRGEVIALLSVALCRQGEVDGLQFRPATLSVDLPDAAEAPTENQTNMNQLLITLLKALGLEVPENPTDEQLTALATAAGEKCATLMAPPPEKKEETPAATLSAGEQAILARLKKVEEGEELREKQAIIDAAVRDGKVVKLSAEQIKGFSAEQLRSVVDMLPKGQVPTSPVTVDGKTTDVTPAVTLSADIARNLGLSGLKPEEIARLAAVA